MREAILLEISSRSCRVYRVDLTRRPPMSFFTAAKLSSWYARYLQTRSLPGGQQVSSTRILLRANLDQNSLTSLIAIYRVSILLWATSWASVEARASSPNNVEARDYTNTQTFPIDRVGPDDEALTKYLRSREGTPVLTTQAGQSVPLEVPDNILAFSLEFLEEQGDNTRFVEGIKNRFIQLRERWARPHR